MPEGKKVSQMFAGISSRYDAANHLLSGGIDFYWRHVLTRLVKEFAPKEIADLATGSGDVAFKLRETIGTGVQIVGLDFCEPMLQKAFCSIGSQKSKPTICTPVPIVSRSLKATSPLPVARSAISFGANSFTRRVSTCLQ